jgi:stage IV sporulation protein FB
MALRFQVAGFPVQVHLLFLLTALAVGATGGWNPARLAVWFGVVFLSVLIHELGHALAFRRFGHGARISLHGLGGTTSSTGGRSLTHRQDLWLSLAGPAAGFLLGGLVLALQRLTPVGQAGGLVGYAVASLLWANFGWGIINLLPILPLDGGHALAAVIRERGGNRFEWLIHGISLAAAAVGLVLAIAWKSLWLGGFALVLGVLNVGQFLRAWVERGYMRKIRAASKRMRPAVKAHEASASIEGFLSQLRPSHRAPQPSPPKPPEAPPEQRASPSPQRPAPPSPPKRSSPPEQELLELPPDPRFLGEWLLDNGLAELALPSLRAAFTEALTPRTGHALATALLEASRYAELTRLLSSPEAAHLGDETLQLIATRAEAAGQPSLATRAQELRQGRASARAPRA